MFPSTFNLSTFDPPPSPQATAAWAFIVTYVLLLIISRIPGLHFRTSKEQELFGDDLGEMGEINVPQSEVCLCAVLCLCVYALCRCMCACMRYDVCAVWLW